MEDIVETWELMVWCHGAGVQRLLLLQQRVPRLVQCSSATLVSLKQIWMIMILIIWTFGAVTLTIKSHAASIPWPWQMFLKCLPWAFTKVSDGADSVPLTQEQDWDSVHLPHWRPQIWIWMIMLVGRFGGVNHIFTRHGPSLGCGWY
ncbi:unnamed protein product [Boreogadus saida]